MFGCFAKQFASGSGAGHSGPGGNGYNGGILGGAFYGDLVQPISIGSGGGSCNYALGGQGKVLQANRRDFRKVVDLCT